MEAAFVSFGVAPVPLVSLGSSSRSTCPVSVRPSRQFTATRPQFTVVSETAEIKAKTAEVEVSEIIFKAEADPGATPTESAAESSEPAAQAWQVPAELRTFGGGNKRTTARSGYTTDRESGMMNSWAIEPKMYVAEDGVSDSVKGILNALGKLFGGAVAEDKKKSQK